MSEDRQKNNISRLKEEADIAAVVDYCGLRRGRSMGNTHFVECPNPEHDDRNPTNAYYRDGWNTVFCTTCCRNMGAIDILMWLRGVPFGEAADILWELEGRPDWYYAKRGNNNPAPPFSASQGELKFLGIKSQPTIYHPVRESKFREADEKTFAPGFRYVRTPEGYRLVKAEHVGMCDFLSPESLKGLVVSRCREMGRELDGIERALGEKGLFPEERAKIQELLNRAEG